MYVSVQECMQFLTLMCSFECVFATLLYYIVLFVYYKFKFSLHEVQMVFICDDVTTLSAIFEFSFEM